MTGGDIIREEERRRKRVIQIYNDEQLKNVQSAVRMNFFAQDIFKWNFSGIKFMVEEMGCEYLMNMTHMGTTIYHCAGHAPLMQWVWLLKKDINANIRSTGTLQYNIS
jgi:hypothetical protein